MLASADRPIVYGSQGGQAPATMEWLVVARTGAAEYFAASPWPRSQPYDEIGTYGGQLDEPGHTELLRALEPIVVTKDMSVATSMDAGLEYLDLYLDERTWSGEWPAQQAPDGLATVVVRLRRMIDALRKRPLRTLEASLAVNGGNVTLRLQNRGTEAFRFSGFGDGSDGSAVHGRVVSTRSTRDARAGLPPQLAASPVLELSGPLTQTPVTIEPGGAVESRIAAAPDGGALESIVRIRFEAHSLGGEAYLEDGWLVPRTLDLVGT